jgi:hypothetical protein
MANPNGILLAFIRGQQEREEEQFKQAKFKQQNEDQLERKRQFDENQKTQNKQLDSTDKYHTEQLRLQQERDKLDLQKSQLDRRLKVGESYTKGAIKPNAWTPDMEELFKNIELGSDGKYPSIPQNAVDVGDGQGQIDLRGFSAPSEFGQAQANIQAPLIREKANAQGEVLRSQFANQSAMEGIRQQGREKIQTRRDEAADKRTREANESRERAAAIRGQYALGSAKIRASAVGSKGTTNDSEEVDANANAAALGRLDLNLTKNGTKARVALRKAGFVELPKKKAEGLANFNSFQSILTDIDSFTDKYATNNPIGRLYNKVASKTTLTDIGSDYKAMLSRAGQIAEVISGEPGRKTEGDIERAMGAIGDPSQNLKNLKNNREKIKRDVGVLIVAKALAGVPEKQKLHVAVNYEIPLEYLGSVNVKGKSYPKYKKQEDGQITVLNPSKGIYEEVEP